MKLTEQIEYIEAQLTNNDLLTAIKQQGLAIIQEEVNRLGEKLNNNNKLDELHQLYKSLVLKKAIELSDYRLATKILESVNRIDHKWIIPLSDYHTPLKQCAIELNKYIQTNDIRSRELLNIVKLLFSKGGQIADFEFEDFNKNLYAFDFAIFFRDIELIEILFRIVNSDNLPPRYNHNNSKQFKKLEKAYPDTMKMSAKLGILTIQAITFTEIEATTNNQLPNLTPQVSSSDNNLEPNKIKETATRRQINIGDFSDSMDEEASSVSESEASSLGDQAEESSPSGSQAIEKLESSQACDENDSETMDKLMDEALDYDEGSSSDSELNPEEREAILEEITNNPGLLALKIRMADINYTKAMVKCVLHLIENNQDITPYKSFLNYRTEQGDTPIILCIKQLIILDNKYQLIDEEDLTAIATGDDLTPLQEYRAEAKPYIEIIKNLLYLGVDIEIENNTNESAWDLIDNINDSHYLLKIFKQHKQINLIEKYFYKTLELESHINLEILNNIIVLIKQYIALKYQYNILNTKVIEFNNPGPDSDEEDIYLNDEEEKSQIEKIKNELNNLKKELEVIIDRIKEENVIDFKIIRIYELICRLIYDVNDYLVPVKTLFSQEIIADDNYYYTFLDGKLYQLTAVVNGHDTIVLQLITSLVYKAERHSLKAENKHLWDNDDYFLLQRNLITKINPEFTDYTLNKFIYYITREETKRGTYFGENLSDDSDSAEERNYRAKTKREKFLLIEYADTLFKRSQPERLKNKSTSKLKTKGMPDYQIEERQKIYRDSGISDTVQKDLEKLNALVLKGELNVDTLKTIGTKFYIAQYRGICYRLDEWSQSSRRLHRKYKEENRPIFSRAVITSANNYSNYADYFNDNQNVNKEQTLLIIAEQLQERLLLLAQSGPVRLALFDSEPYTYGNALLALQDLYTKNYDKFHIFLTAFVNKFSDMQSNVIQLTEIEDVIRLSISNPNNFLVSTSDTPDHALRYAYGDKFYESYKDKRLRPRWREDGRAERPHSGKVIISLHEPLELLSISHHIISLDAEGKVKIDLQKIPERETSFFSYIPSNRVVSEHVAKFPSFVGNYKEIFLKKYGLTPELYQEFQLKIKTTKPHTPNNKHIKKLLTEHLISYQEVCLIEEAKIAAKQSGGVLIYRSREGGFSLFPCQTPQQTTNTNISDQKRKATSQANLDHINNKRKQQKSIHPKDGFLFNLNLNFNIQVKQIKDNSLLECLVSEIGCTSDELKTIVNENNFTNLNSFTFFKIGVTACSEPFAEYEKFLELIAQRFKVNIIIHNPMFENNYKRITSASAESDINLYFLGGQQFTILKPKDLNNNSSSQNRNLI